ncbi:MAG: ADP-ribosylglycohydrolase family protein [Anaerovoracaceae bacterium]
MLGAILGDIIGSPYEFDMNNIKTTTFPLFGKKSHFTDDTVMTLAVAEGLMDGYGDKEKTAKTIVRAMQRLGRKYPNSGYGLRFIGWLNTANPQPYKSYGNGSAMRVSAVAWIYNNLCDVEDFAEISAKVTHNHPEGIKGAKATAAAIFLARQGADKKYIQKYIEDKYKYCFNRTCDEIRVNYHHVESCQETVPEAITAFLEGDSFEEVIRLAVSLGGDSDTLTAIAGSIAEAYYPIPEDLRKKAVSMIDSPLRAVLHRYRGFLENIRAKRYEQFERLISYKSYFAKGDIISWVNPQQVDICKDFSHPCYGKEVSTLEDFAQSRDFVDFDYGNTLSRFDMGMDMEKFKANAETSCPLAIRAMLTSIVRQERLCQGLIATAIESGLISQLLGAYEKQICGRIL